MKIKKSQLISISLILFLTLILTIPKISTASTVETSSESAASLIFNPQIKGFLPRYVFEENSTKPIAEVIKIIFEYGIKVIALMALIVTIIGGLLWSIAGGSSQKVGEAKQWIFSGLSGLLLILFSYVLLNTINPALVNLKTSTIKTIGKLNLVYENKSDPNQFHEDNAQRTMTIASSTNPNGSIACCIINTPQVHANAIRGVQTLNCATYQTTYYKGLGADSAEALCKQFYESRSGLTLNSEIPLTTPAEAKAIGSRSAALFVGRCETNELFKEICMGKDHEDYCKIKNIGSSCITSDNYWGYCNGQKECSKGVGYGQEAEHSYQCPTYIGILDANNNVRPLKDMSSSPQVFGHKCGDEASGCLSTSNNKQCLCYGSFCYNECKENGGFESTGFFGWGRDICKNIRPNQRSLYVGINSSQPNCRR
jgi:hypothetical protein